VHRKNILIYVKQDTTLRSLFYLETAVHVSGGTTTHLQERKQLYLCLFLCLRSWWWVVVSYILEDIHTRVSYCWALCDLTVIRTYIWWLKKLGTDCK